MKQITEDYCSYEIAKLLKEKGFNEEVRTFYNSKGIFEDYLFPLNHNLDIGSVFTSAPSQSLALKWLREVYHLSIDVFASHYCFEYTIAVLPQGTIIRDIESGFHNTYEQAVEAACLYVLKNLI